MPLIHTAIRRRLSNESHLSNTGGFFSVGRMFFPRLDDSAHLFDFAIVDPVCFLVEDGANTPPRPRIITLAKFTVGTFKHGFDGLADAAMTDHIIQKNRGDVSVVHG